MNETSAEQAAVFLMCIFSGAVSGAIFDVFRIIRRTSEKNAVMTNLCDALFWLFYSTFFISFIYRINDGELRWYVFAASALGMTLYFILFSRLFVPCGVFLLKVIIKILEAFVKIIFVPIRFLIKKTGTAAVVVLSPVKGFIKRIRLLKRKFILSRRLMKKI